MSHWNHRVMRHVDHWGNSWFCIHEVHYRGDGSIFGWTQDEKGETLLSVQGIEGLRWTLERMLACLDKPILNYADGKEWVDERTDR